VRGSSAGLRNRPFRSSPARAGLDTAPGRRPGGTLARLLFAQSPLRTSLAVVTGPVAFVPVLRVGRLHDQCRTLIFGIVTSKSESFCVSGSKWASTVKSRSRVRVAVQRNRSGLRPRANPRIVFRAPSSTAGRCRAEGRKPFWLPTPTAAGSSLVDRSRRSAGPGVASGPEQETCEWSQPGSNRRPPGCDIEGPR
jgi:hypothetical protein